MDLQMKASPMRLAKCQVTDADALRAIVEACHTVRIGATDEEGPFIVPMSFGFEWDERGDGAHLALWLHSAREGRKARAFAARDTDGVRVAIEMDREDGIVRGDYSCAYSFAYRSIMGTGIVRAVEDAAEKRAGLARIMEHMAPGEAVAFSPEAVERVAVWRVDIERFTGKQRAAR